MATARTITVYDNCTTEGCGKRLMSLREAESGQCSGCWIKTISPEKKKAFNRLIACAFNGASEQEKDAAVTDALKHVKEQP